MVNPEYAPGRYVARIMHAADHAVPSDLTASLHQGVLLFRLDPGKNAGEKESPRTVAGRITVVNFAIVERLDATVCQKGRLRRYVSLAATLKNFDSAAASFSSLSSFGRLWGVNQDPMTPSKADMSKVISASNRLTCAGVPRCLDGEHHVDLGLLLLGTDRRRRWQKEFDVDGVGREVRRSLSLAAALAARQSKMAIVENRTRGMVVSLAKAGFRCVAKAVVC